MNQVILMGRLTHDPELSQTQSGVSVSRFSLAVNRRFAKEGQQQADFINCTAWRQQAEFICKYFKKGNMIALTGSIQTRSWEDKDGKKLSATEVVANEAYFTGEKTEKSNQNKNDGESPAGADGFFTMSSTDDDDLPF